MTGLRGGPVGSMGGVTGGGGGGGGEGKKPVSSISSKPNLKLYQTWQIIVSGRECKVVQASGIHMYVAPHGGPGGGPQVA